MPTGQDLYRIRDFVPDFEAIAAEVDARSRATLSRHTVSEIAYGADPRERIDVIVPAGVARHAPLHMFVHGGYWRAGETRAYACVAEPVLAAGGIAALCEYRLMPETRLGAIVAAVREAARQLLAAAPRLGADPARFTVSGHSAGAHLSSYLAAAGPQETAAPDIDVKALLLVSGIYDLSDIPGSFLKDETRMTDAEARAFSPLTARHAAGPLRIISRGGDETAPFHDQALALEEGLRAQGRPGELRSEPGRNHMDIVLDLADADRPLGRRLADLVAG